MNIISFKNSASNKLKISVSGTSNLNSNNRNIIINYDDSSTNKTISNIESDLQVNTWNHIAIVFDVKSGNNYCDYYQNGLLKTSSQLTSNLPILTRPNCEIGDNLKRSRMFDLMVLNKSMNRDEIDTIRLNGVEPPKNNTERNIIYANFIRTSSANVEKTDIHSITTLETTAKAVEFDGSSDYYLSSTTTNITSQNDGFTISVWVNIDSNGASEQRIIDYGLGASNKNIILQCNKDANTGLFELEFIYYNESNAERKIDNIVNISPNTWTHIAVSISPVTTSESTIMCYINGVIKKDGTKVGYISSESRNYYIGKSQDNSKYFKGKMFDLFAYNKQLSGTEINIIKDHGKSSKNFPENPVIESLVKTSSSITPYVVTSIIDDNQTILSDDKEIYSLRNSVKTGISTFIDAHCKDIITCMEVDTIGNIYLGIWHDNESAKIKFDKLNSVLLFKINHSDTEWIGMNTTDNPVFNGIMRISPNGVKTAYISHSSKIFDLAIMEGYSGGNSTNTHTGTVDEANRPIDK